MSYKFYPQKFNIKNQQGQYINLAPLISIETDEQISDINNAAQAIKSNILATIENRMDQLLQNVSNASDTANLVAPYFDSTVDYDIGDCVVYNINKLYKFINQHTAGQWNDEDVQEIKVIDLVTNLLQEKAQEAIDEVMIIERQNLDQSVEDITNNIAASLNQTVNNLIDDPISRLTNAAQQAETKAIELNNNVQTITGAIAHAQGNGVDSTLTLSNVAADAKTTGDMLNNLHDIINISNKSIFNISNLEFPIQFENGTYQYTQVNQELIKYYDNGYNLTRKVIKNTTLDVNCQMYITAKTGYAFTIFTSVNRIITSASELIKKCMLYPGKQYGIILRAENGTTDISNIDVSQMINIEYISDINTKLNDLNEKFNEIINTPENICYITENTLNKVSKVTCRQSAEDKNIIEIYGTGGGLGNFNPFNGSNEAGTGNLTLTKWLPAGIYTIYFTRSTSNIKVCKTTSTASNRTTLTNGQVITVGEEGACIFIHFDSGSVFGTSDNPSTLNLRVYEGENVPDNLVINREVIVDSSNIFVATDGNDANDGTFSKPVATVDHALELGAKNIYVKAGTYYQRVDLSKAQHGEVNISNIATQKVIFMNPSCIVASSSEAVPTYTNVYSATTNKTFHSSNNLLFQDNIADTSTEITFEKRLPEQKFNQYRCLDTKIIKSTKTTRTQALNDINTSSNYKWYLDQEGIIYFNCPQALSPQHPLCVSGGASNTVGFTYNNSKNISLSLTGINVKYMYINGIDLAKLTCIDCSASNVFSGGAFKFDAIYGAMFIRCEASRAFTNNTNGDGFNATGRTTATFIDCWAHDNNDDGISLHVNGEFTVIGGLYEYNLYGGGITPANGAKCNCYNVYCRDNGDGGFLYMNGDSSGIGGVLKCISCVSDSNNIWNNGNRTGYMIDGDTTTGTNNKGIFINCIALNQRFGYRVKHTESTCILINCTASNCTNTKYGDGTFIITNATPVA